MAYLFYQALFFLLYGSIISEANPTYETISDAEVVWEKPLQPKAVLFVAHGCQHGAIDWWPKSPDCPNCIGLPEERNITQRALARGYAIVAISSHDRIRSRCWHAVTPLSPEKVLVHTADTEQVSKVLEKLLKRHGLQDLPLYALGASSGGAFVLVLPFFMKVAGVCSQISAFSPTMFRKMSIAARTVDNSFTYPPTMFVHMPRDEFTASHVFRMQQILTRQEVNNTAVEVNPQLITSVYLRHKLPLTEDQADKLIQALRLANVIDSQGVPLADPRMVDWRLEVEKFPELQHLPNKADQSALPEVLNVAYASHEIVSDTTDQMLDWWESLAKQS